MSALLVGNSLASLAKPFLLLTFACSDQSMKECDIFQDRFQSQEECLERWSQVERNASFPGNLINPAHSVIVSYCSNTPEQGEEGIFPVSPLNLNF